MTYCPQTKQECEYWFKETRSCRIIETLSHNAVYLLAHGHQDRLAFIYKYAYEYTIINLIPDYTGFIL